MATTRAATAIAKGRGYQTVIGAASLAVGPLVMALGDLLHPKESRTSAARRRSSRSRRRAGTWRICCCSSAWSCSSPGC